MKYIAQIKLGTDSFSRSFESVKEAKSWLDSENNNIEHTTTISEVDDKWNVVDWFVYTQGTENL